MATKSDSIRYTQLRKQIVDIYEKASAGITNENELDKSVITALNDGGFDVFYGDQLTGLKPQKFDFILNPEDHPADHIDYYDGEVIDKPQQAMSWELYLDTYKTEDPYSVILVRKKMEHTNPHIQQAKLGTNIKTKRMRKQTLSQKANYVPNRMINEVEVERNGKVTFVDGANILDGVYVKKGVKYKDGGQMNETFPDVDGKDNMSFMAGGKVKKRKFIDYDEYDYKDESIFDKKPDLIVKNNVDDEWGDVKVWYKGKKTIVLSSDPGGYGAPALQIEGIVKDQDELLSYAKGLAGTDEEGDIFSSDTGGKVGKLKLKTIADLVENEKAVKEFLTKKIKENYLKGATFKTDDYIEGSWEQDDAVFEMEELIGKDVYEYVSEDESDTYMELVNAWRDGIAVKLGGSSRKINAEWDGVSGDKRAKEIIDNLVESNDYNPGTKADLKKALTKYLAKKSKDIGDEDFQDMLLNASYLYGFDMDDDGEKVADDVFDMIENEESVTAIMKYLENVNKAKRGTTIKNKQMAESTTKRRFDKMYKASKPGERKSKKFAKIERADGTTFRRRNANDSYPDGVPGGKTYSEKRPNRTDKRVYLEQGGSLGEGMGTYESTLQSNIEMGEGIEMAKRGKKIPEYNREADKQFAAMGPGERTSKRFAKIYKKDGTYFRRKNANGSYPDGVPGGLDYTENRPNRSDKRIWLEDGGSLPMEDGGSFSGEGFTYEIGGL